MIQWFCDLQKLNVTELSEYVLQFLPNIVILFVHPTINEVCIVCCVCVCVCACGVCVHVLCACACTFAYYIFLKSYVLHIRAFLLSTR